MVSSPSFFINSSSSSTSVVTLPNGQTTYITHNGTIMFSSTLFLTGVLVVPSFNFNLLSISKLYQHSNCSVFFEKISCYIQDLTTCKGEESDGLYYMHPLDDDLINSPASFLAHSSYDLWHSRLGHLLTLD